MSAEAAGTPLVELERRDQDVGQGQVALLALKGIDAHDQRGASFVAIMGEQGRATSTMMNILGCLDTPTEGCYVFRGTHLEQASRRQRALGAAALPWASSSRASTCWPAPPRSRTSSCPALSAGNRTPFGRKSALAALRVGGPPRVGEPHLRRAVGGPAAARRDRACPGQPPILLLRRATGNLDTQRGRRGDGASGLRSTGDQGLTVVMVTHEADMAHYAKRVVHFLDGGRRPRPPNGGSRLMLWNSLLLAVRAIRRNVLRSFLTILGVVIGVASVIVMVTLGGRCHAGGEEPDARAWAPTCSASGPACTGGPEHSEALSPNFKDRPTSKPSPSRSSQ